MWQRVEEGVGVGGECVIPPPTPNPLVLKRAEMSIGEIKYESIRSIPRVVCLSVC